MLEPAHRDASRYLVRFQPNTVGFTPPFVGGHQAHSAGPRLFEQSRQPVDQFESANTHGHDANTKKNVVAIEATGEELVERSVWSGISRVHGNL